MNRKMRKQFKFAATHLVCCLLCLLMLSGCAANESKPEESSSVSSGEVSSAPKAESIPDVKESESPVPPEEELPGELESSAIPEESESEPIPEIPEIPSAEPYWLNSIIIYGKMALEPFQSLEGPAGNYAQVISNIKTALGDVKVYNMIVPTHVEFALPERYRGTFSDSQRGTLDTLYGGYTADVVGVDIYDILARKKGEYLYFNTDHHWTGLAAYYAYTEFAKAAGFTPVAQESMEKKNISGLLGSLYDATGLDLLRQNPDTVEYFRIPGNYSCTSVPRGGIAENATMLLHEYAQGVYAYGVFLGGDSTLFVVRNQAEDMKGKKKIAVIKDSFGNAFAPYLAPHYSEVHVIDLRYFNRNLVSYVKQNGIDEVLVINNIKAMGNPTMQNYLSGMIS